jgi:hypothetical protein
LNLKNYFFLLFLTLIIACREEVEGWNSLSPDEQEEISSRALRNCLSSNAAYYEEFISDSSKTYELSTYERGKGFLHEFKLDSTTLHSVELRVWRNASEEIYFYVTESDESGSVASYFLRVEKTQNEEMINQFKTDHCEKYYSSVSISDGGPLVVKLEYDVAAGSDSKEYTDTYTFNFSKLAFLGNYFLERKVITKDSEDVQTESKSYSSTFSSKTYSSDFPTTDFSDSDEYEQNFCELIPESGQSVFRLTEETIGFNNKNCSTSLPADWNLEI